MTFKPAHLLVVLLATALPAMAQNLATVNGKAIPASRLEILVKQVTAQGQQQDSPQLRAMLKQELINREVLIQEAEKSGLANNAEVKQAIEASRQSILVRALMIEQLKKSPVSDAEVQAEYDKLKAQAGDKEYHLYHILLEKEDDAKAVISKLKAGAKFEELAKQSKDAGSASKGGDLEWSTPNNWDPTFATAVKALQKGQFTETPVKSQAGFHIIKLDDTRTAKFPTVEEVKPQFVEGLQQQRVQAYQQALIKKAKIQ
ncbi:peptidylprolyl isomerase [Undibacterium umbellatum]|uniref:peptidylprolyl isomerase n=1 Tax=Undibacterium umbellatum TaxID=2762300 RepID=A0ABR6Z3S5_9BURK|nr:peptidylprolyl isomerase [Undibacterium umbellatum]MBC3906380.1 peptidylprolyl isomerase [Undibacterium umbellatum]